jgi:hypothetical protein
LGFLGCRSGLLQFLVGRRPLRVPFRHLDRSSATVVGYESVDSLAAGHGEKSPLSLGPLIAQEVQQRGRILAGTPVRSGNQTTVDGSLATEQGIQDPAAADVWLVSPAVVENRGVAAPDLHEGFGKEQNVAEAAGLFNLACQRHGGIALA